jgi:hypothetical protein
MSTFIWILLISVAVLLPIKAALLYWVFRDDIREYVAERRQRAIAPVCMYCHSKWTEPADEGSTRWEGDELVLVTTYVCQHCNLPFWHVERVAAAAARR